MNIQYDNYELTFEIISEEYATAKLTGCSGNDYYSEWDVSIPGEIEIDSKKYTVIAIDSNAFGGMYPIKSVQLPNSITSIGDSAFYGCTSLSNITIPDSVKIIGDYAFGYCYSLTSITIGDSVTSMGEGVFEACESLMHIVIPDSLTTIGNYAFNSCSSLTGITIPDSVTSIGNGAFIGCSTLTNIIIPNGVKTIGEDAFLDCENLSNIYYKGTKYQRDNYIDIHESNANFDDKWHYSIIGRLKMGDGFKNIAEVFTIVEGNKKVITNVSKI